MVYPHTLILQHDNNAPAILLALAADAELYSEAVAVYKEINAKVTSENQEAFAKLKLHEAIKIRHLKIVFPDLLAAYVYSFFGGEECFFLLADTLGNRNLSLFTSKPPFTLRNYLMSLTIDMSYPVVNPEKHVPFELVKKLVNASESGIERISVRWWEWGDGYSIGEAQWEARVRDSDIERIDRCLGVAGRVEGPEESIDLSDGGWVMWVWRRDGGGSLSWRDRQSQADAERISAVHSLHERSARAWKRDLTIRREL